MKLFRYLVTFAAILGIVSPVSAATLNGNIRFEDFSFDGLSIPLSEPLGFQGNIAQPFTITTPNTSTAATTTNLFGDFLPQTNNAYDIGKVATKWRYGFFSAVSSTSSTIDNLYLANGTAAIPSLSFIVDTNTGLYRPAVDEIGLSASGTVRQSWSSTSTIVYGQNGTGYLVLSANEIDALYNIPSGKHHIQVASSTIAVVSSTGIGVLAGTLANPSYGFIADADTGFFWDTTTSTVSVVVNENIAAVASSSGFSVMDDKYISLGNSVDARLEWETADASAHYLNIVTGASRNIVISQNANIDWGHAGQTNSTLWIHGDSADLNDWLALLHTGTNATIDWGSGSLQLSGATSVDMTRDGVPFRIGANQDAQLAWNASDANANAFVLALPAGDATNVPVFTIGDTGGTSILSADLGFFNGITDPTLALVSADNSRYFRAYQNGTDAVLDVSAGVIRVQIASSSVAIVSSTSISLINGTLANPSYSFTNDTNSGLKIDVTTSSLDLVKDGFIVYSATSSASGGKSVFSGTFGYTPIATTTLSTAHSVTTTGRIMRLQGDGGATTIVSTPSVQAGFNGQIVTFVGTSDVNTVILQDDTGLAASGLRLAGNANFTLGLNDIIELQYDSVAEVWQERFRSNN